MGHHRSYGSKGENTERLILDTLEEIVAVGDREGIILDANQAMARRFGMPLEDLIGKCAWDLLPPDMAEQRRVHLEEVLQSGRPVRFEDQSGERWFENSVYPIPDQKGRVARVVLLAKDITERKVAQKGLKEKDQLLNNILEASPIGIAYAEERRVLWGSKTMAGMFGYGKGEEYLGKDIRAFYSSEEEYDRVGRFLYAALKAGAEAETEARFRRKDGSLFDGFIRISAPDPSIPMHGTVVTIMDVTERRQMEEKLRESEAKFRLIADYSNSAEVFWNERGDLVYVSPGFRKLFGYDPEDYLSGRLHFTDLVHPDDHKRASQLLSRTCTPDKYEDIQFRVFSKDREMRTVSVSSQPVFTEERRFRGRRTSVRDITAYKRALEALQESEEKYRILFSAESDAIMVHDLEEFRYVDVNDAAVRLYGYTADEFAALTVQDVTTDFEAAKKTIEEVLREGMARVPLRWHRRKDGTVFPVEMSGASFVLRGRRFVSTINRDITERLKVEEKMKRHQQELEKVVLERTADLLKTKEELLEELEKRRKIEEQLLRHQRRLQTLASQLVLSEERERRHLASYLHDNIGHALALAKHRLESIRGTEDSLEFERGKADMTDLIQSTIEEARRLTFALSPPILYDLGLEPAVEWLGEKILQENGIEFELETQGRNARLNDEVRILLYQTIKELVVNIVKHAKASRARIMLRTGGGTFTAHVEDDGIGLAEELQREGMPLRSGYGLFSIRERLQSMGGSMKITSCPEGGTRVTVRIPLMINRERSERSEDHED